MRAVKAQHAATRSDVDDLVTWRALPTHSVDRIDPFLFLNHHGPQSFPPKNHGLPFGPHPHRGFETVTFILKGDIAHKHTGSGESIIKEGGVQWMTAGRGLVHSETSSNEFMENGGELEVLQLWVNLPSRLKMVEPRYIGLQRHQIPSLPSDDRLTTIHLICGTQDGYNGPVQPLIDMSLVTVEFLQGARVAFSVSASRNVFFYVVKGELIVNGTATRALHLLEFRNEGERIEIEAPKDAFIIFGHAEPIREPVVAYGPFVMNTREEITAAIRDYQSGKFG